MINHQCYQNNANNQLFSGGIILCDGIKIIIAFGSRLRSEGENVAKCVTAVLSRERKKQPPGLTCDIRLAGFTNRDTNSLRFPDSAAFMILAGIPSKHGIPTKQFWKCFTGNPTRKMFRR